MPCYREVAGIPSPLFRVYEPIDGYLDSFGIPLNTCAIIIIGVSHMHHKTIALFLTVLGLMWSCGTPVNPGETVAQPPKWRIASESIYDGSRTLTTTRTYHYPSLNVACYDEMIAVQNEIPVSSYKYTWDAAGHRTSTSRWDLKTTPNALKSTIYHAYSGDTLTSNEYKDASGKTYLTETVTLDSSGREISRIFIAPGETIPQDGSCTTGYDASGREDSGTLIQTFAGERKSYTIYGHRFDANGHLIEKNYTFDGAPASPVVRETWVYHECGRPSEYERYEIETVNPYALILKIRYEFSYERY